MDMTLIPRSWRTAVAGALLLTGAGFFLLACGGGGGSSNTAATGGYSVSGEITFAANSAIDSDVNDPEAPYASNDLYNDPLHPENGLDANNLVQRVSRLVTLGGYVNLPGQGVRRPLVCGRRCQRFFRGRPGGRPDDHSERGRGGGQPRSFHLRRSEFRSAQLPRRRKRPARIERIQIATAGTYFIEVRAVSGASNYSLNLTAAMGEAQAAAFDGGGDFVSGDVIVRFKDAGAGAASAGSPAAGMAPPGLTAKSGEPGRAMLFEVRGASRAGTGGRPPVHGAARQLLN